MQLKTISLNNGNSHCKSYKTVKAAKAEIAKIEKELEELKGGLKYVIAINDNDRFYLQFLINNATSELSFHWIINRGHCVCVI